MKNFIFLFFSTLLLLIVACNPPQNQAEEPAVSERNKNSIITANEELFNKGNLSHADRVFVANYNDEGPAWIKKHVGAMRTAFPDIKVTVDPIIGEGNKTAWLRTHTGTHKGAFLGFEPTGKKITWQTMIISEYNEEGKVLKEWAVSDLYEVLEQSKKDFVEEEDQELE